LQLQDTGLLVQNWNESIAVMFRNNYDNDSVTLYVIPHFRFVCRSANVGAAHPKAGFSKLNILKKP
jgi:hypothetical protein